VRERGKWEGVGAGSVVRGRGGGPGNDYSGGRGAGAGKGQPWWRRWPIIKIGHRVGVEESERGRNTTCGSAHWGRPDEQ
jgi:hypothetical protein